MQTMAQLLAEKGTRVFSILPGATVLEGLQVMADMDIGALVVIDKGRPIGLVSERDYTRKVVLKGRSSRDTPVSAIMVTAFDAAPPDATIDMCMNLMTRQRTRHVLIMDGERLCGIVSIGDLVRATIDDQKFTIAQMEKYIHS
ncbi:MAG: CBS domain-containing protein [Vicinamibacterales bacterium]